MSYHLLGHEKLKPAMISWFWGQQVTLKAYLFGNQAAVHLIVHVSDVHSTCGRGAGYVKAKGNSFLCNQGRHFCASALT